MEIRKERERGNTPLLSYGAGHSNGSIPSKAGAKISITPTAIAARPTITLTGVDENTFPISSIILSINPLIT